MRFQFSLLLLVLYQQSSLAFHVPISSTSLTQKSSTALFAKSRKARRDAEKQTNGRTNQFYDAMKDAEGRKKKEKEEPLPKQGPPNPEEDEIEDEREKFLTNAQKRMDARPALSTMIVDEETGVEVIAQGQSVLDVVTRKAVKLSDLGPDYRLAQMFPGLPSDLRNKYRFDWKTAEVPEMVEKLRDACSVKLEDGSRGIPPHPSVANKGIDFVLANRDLLGYKMKRTLGRLQMRNMWKDNVQEAREIQQLWKNFETLENHISGPFRQILMDAEGRLGPNFGNLDIMKFCDGELYERVGNYIVLKGMVAHWEKKVTDADYVEKTPQTPENFVTVLARGDPKRYLPEPPILFTLKDCTQVYSRAQQMCKAFVENEELFGDFPPEIIFLEEALSIKGGTALRKYMISEFCPARGVTPEGLREGMRRLCQQLENMQTDPYGDLTNKVEELYHAMEVGTDDERDPYEAYLCNPDPKGPGYFQTYTFNHAKYSLVRFLDNQYPSATKVDLFVPIEEDDAPSEGVSTLVCSIV
jgi:hypothetical protein